MTPLTHVASLGGSTASVFGGILDLAWLSVGGRDVLYMLSRPDGVWLTAYAAGPDGALVELGRADIPGLPVPGLSARLAVAPEGDAPSVFVSGLAAPGLVSVALDASGAPMAAVAAVAGTASLQAFLPAGSGIAYAVDAGAEAIDLLRMGPDGAFEAFGQVPAPGGIGALALADHAGARFLLAAASGEVSLASYAVAEDGSLRVADTLLAVDGPGIAAPSAVAAATVEDATYAIVAGAGSSSLSVLRLDADGGMTVADQLIDDLTTRFDHVGQLAVATTAQRVYVAAAGGDDGVSLFRLLPGGRLLHLATLEDAAGRALADVASLSLGVTVGGLHLVTASTSEATIAWHRMELDPDGLTLRADPAGAPLAGGDGDDLLAGGSGDDRLSGGAGRDILMDGPGDDTLLGGPGADVFVMAWDDAPDRIEDYDPAEDRIDLSAWPMFRDASQLSVTSVAGGSEIRFRAETLTVSTRGGRALDDAAVAALTPTGGSRFLPAWFGPPPENPPPPDAPGISFTGTAADDIIPGSDGDDTLAGAGGDDVLFGGAGDDRLDGGDGDDVLSGGLGADELIGGAGVDLADYVAAAEAVFADLLNPVSNTGEAAGDSYTGIENLRGSLLDDDLRGDNGDNLINASTGNDFVLGRAGSDTLIGGDGDDTLAGQDGNDVLNGGAGNDRLVGGGGNDRMLGGDGNDSFVGTDGNNSMIGGSGNDTMFDGRGDSTLFGGTGADRLIGGGGNDRILGGFGNDRLSGLNGNDTLSGAEGNDFMVGGNGVDTFVFNVSRIDTDTVGDFAIGTDRLFIDRVLTGGELDAAQVVEDFATVTADGVVFDFGGGNTITLLGLASTAGLEADMLIT